MFTNSRFWINSLITTTERSPIPPMNTGETRLLTTISYFSLSAYNHLTILRDTTHPASFNNQLHTTFSFSNWRFRKSHERSGNILIAMISLTIETLEGGWRRCLLSKLKIETWCVWKVWDFRAEKGQVEGRSWILTVVARTECGQHPTRKLLHTLLSLNFIANSGSPKNDMKIFVSWIFVVAVDVWIFFTISRCSH